MAALSFPFARRLLVIALREVRPRVCGVRLAAFASWRLWLALRLAWWHPVVEVD